MIKNRLKVRLAERDMTMADLARETDLHYTTINRFARDDQTLISKETLNAVCGALRLSPGDIFEYIPDQADDATP